MLALSLYGLAARSLGLLLLVAIAGLAMFRASASMRRAVWLIGIIAAMALPFIWRLAPAAKVPSDHIPGYISVVDREPVRMTLAQLDDYAKPAKLITPVGTSKIDPTPEPVSPFAVMLVGWACVTGFLVCRLVVGLSLAASLIRRSTPFESKTAQSQAFHAGISKPVRILINDRLAVPAAAGFIRPAVILPKQATEWPDKLLRMVLAHELAHIRQNDWIYNIFGQVACAMYPFNPFVWLCAGRLRAESEVAADDRAILSGIEPTAYARALVAIASAARRQPAIVVAMARSAKVEFRIKSITKVGRRRGAAALVPVLLATLTAATTCGAIAAFRIGSPKSFQALAGGIGIDYNGLDAGWKGPLTVRVIDEDGRPCPGAKLHFILVAPFGTGLATTAPAAITDVNGEYRLDPAQAIPTHGEPPGFFQAASIEGVMAYRQGHALTLGDPFTRQDPRTTVRLTKSSSARIRVLGPDGRPASGIALAAKYFVEKLKGEISVPLEYRIGAYRVTTDAAGIAEFHDIPEGYSVTYTIEDDRYLPASRYQDNPAAHGATEYPALHLVASATIEGNLLLNGKPLSNVKIQVNSGGESAARQAVTDKAGHYRVIRVPDGICDVHYIVPSGSSTIPDGWVARQHDGIRITPGENLTGVDFTFERGGVVKGKVIDENGQPRDYSVSAMSPEFVEFRNGIASNPPDFFTNGGSAQGLYELRMPVGRYKLRLGIGPDNPEQWVDVKEGQVTTANFQVNIKARTRTIGGSMCGEPDDD